MLVAGGGGLERVGKRDVRNGYLNVTLKGNRLPFPKVCKKNAGISGNMGLDTLIFVLTTPPSHLRPVLTVRRRRERGPLLITPSSPLFLSSAPGRLLHVSSP